MQSNNIGYDLIAYVLVIGGLVLAATAVSYMSPTSDANANKKRKTMAIVYGVTALVLLSIGVYMISKGKKHSTVT